MEEVIKAHFVPVEVNLYYSSESIPKIYLLYMAKNFFSNPGDYSYDYSVILDYFGNNKEDISFIFAGNSRLQQLKVSILWNRIYLTNYSVFRCIKN